MPKKKKHTTKKPQRSTKASAGSSTKKRLPRTGPKKKTARKKIAAQQKQILSRPVPPASEPQKKSLDLTTPIIELHDSIIQSADIVAIEETPHQLNSEAPAAAGKPPKDIPPRPTSLGANFISEPSNIFNQLAFVNLVQLVLIPFRWLAERMAQPVDGELSEEAAEEIEDIFAPLPTRRFLGISIQQRWYRPVAIFTLVAIVFVIPLQAYTYYQSLQETRDKILVLSDEAINYLQLGQQAALQFDLSVATNQFTQAKENFSLARQEISDLSGITTEILKVIPGLSKSVETGNILLLAGERFADVGQILTQAGNNFLSQQGQDYYSALLELDNELAVALEKFAEAKQEIDKISAADIPSEHQATFNQVITSLPALQQRLSQAKIINNALLKLLGRDQWQRYLLIFTNNNELRATGGFMGSFALLDLDRGQIKNLEVPSGGTYDIQGQLIPRVIAPAPLHLINPRWEFQDANWWPDFPTTAKKIQWFYHYAGGPSTDGVIVITATMMSRLLDVLGPITVPEYDLTVDGSNFVSLTQEIIRQSRDEQAAKPKQFLTDLAPRMLEQLFAAEGDQLKSLLTVIQQSLNEKHVLLYFSDPTIQQIASSLDWSGQLKQTEGDFLSVVHTNLAGGKTDEVITEIIDHQAEINPDGSITDTVTLRRTHHGVPGENIFTGVQNNSYVRFYVPAGSSLISARGFEKPNQDLFEEPGDDLELDIDLLSVQTDYYFDQQTGTDIYKESGKTVFGNWLQLKAGETQEAQIKYRLPFSLAQEGENAFYYSLLSQKQSGSLHSEIISRLHLTDSYEAIVQFPSNLPIENNTVTFTAPLITDRFYGVVLTHQ